MPGENKNQIFIYYQDLWEHAGLNMIASRLPESRYFISLSQHSTLKNPSPPWLKYKNNAQWRTEKTKSVGQKSNKCIISCHQSLYKPTHLCSFPRESPTVFFTSSFPGFSTCSFKPVNPPKGIFSGSLSALPVGLLTVSWYTHNLLWECENKIH